jgi:hypothetical protein
MLAADEPSSPASKLKREKRQHELFDVSYFCMVFAFTCGTVVGAHVRANRFACCECLSCPGLFRKLQARESTRARKLTTTTNAGCAS